MITVTADTNIYISGLVFGGQPLVFLNHARAGTVRLAISPPILTELQRVLHLKFGWSVSEIEAALEQLRDASALVEPTETLDVVPEDPDDNRILECAVAANAAVIVSGDSHLLRLGSFRGIPIVTVADLVASLPAI